MTLVLMMVMLLFNTYLWMSTSKTFVPFSLSLRHPYIENPSGLPERTNDVAGAYAQACVDIARECATPVVDIWTKMQEYTDWKKSCLSDGLHLTQGGNRIVFEEVLGKLKEVGVSLEKLPVDLPLFSDINPKDPLKAFES